MIMPRLLYSRNPVFDPYKLTRSKAVQQKYEARLQKLAESNITPEQYILDTVFGADSTLIIAVPNEFPYKLEKGQIHMILWVKEVRLTDPFAMTEYLNKNYGGDIIEAIWYNSPEEQSVKDLVHFHFIINQT